MKRLFSGNTYVIIKSTDRVKCVWKYHTELIDERLSAAGGETISLRVL